MVNVKIIYVTFIFQLRNINSGCFIIDFFDNIG